MKRMAQVDANGIVVNIIVANDDWNVDGFVEYTDNNPAYIGGSYANGRFIPPRPGNDAVLDEETGMWIMFVNSINTDYAIANQIGGDSLGA
jgi:hypothetical protein